MTCSLIPIVGIHTSKGRQVYVEGRLQTRSWEDPQGQKKYTTEIVANNIQFLGGAGQRAESGASHSSDMTQSDRGFSPEPAFNSDEEIPF
jgi:single-strand DNA-binding protein